MKNTYNLYLFIGLLFSIVAPLQSLAPLNNQEKIVLTEQDCDDILHALFAECFFNDNDKTPFSQIVTHIIEILHVKKCSFDQASQKKCNDFIILLEKNKEVTSFLVWAKILMTSDLISLLPEKTQEFLNSISGQEKMKALRNKLNNN